MPAPRRPREANHHPSSWPSGAPGESSTRDQPCSKEWPEASDSAVERPRGGKDIFSNPIANSASNIIANIITNLIVNLVIFPVDNLVVNPIVSLVVKLIRYC